MKNRRRYSTHRAYGATGLGSGVLFEKVYKRRIFNRIIRIATFREDDDWKYHSRILIRD